MSDWLNQLPDEIVWWSVNASQIQLIALYALLPIIVMLIINPRIFMRGRSYSYRRKESRECANYTKRLRKSGKSKFCGERCEKQYRNRAARQDYKGRKWHRNRLFAKSNICGICKLPILNAKEATIDHIIPLDKDGIDDITNMQLAHESCNQAKGNEMPANLSAGRIYGQSS